MTHKLAIVVPSAAVASAGTLTASYPAGTSAGDFAAYGHKMWSRGLQKMFSQDDGNISVAFGASDITVTYNGATPIPANTQCTVELNIAGSADAPASIVDPKRVSFMPLMRLDLGTPDTADDNGIVESQNLTTLGVYSTLAFNGVYGDPYGNLKAVLDVPRNVVAGWTGTAILTVTGKDEYGDVIVEKSASSTSFTGKKAFKEITSITTNADITALTVGTGDVLGLPVFLPGTTHITAEIVDGVIAPTGDTIALVATSPSLADAGQVYVAAPVAGDIVAVYAVTNTVVATDDATITVKGPDGTVGTIVIALSGTAVGVVDAIDAIANAHVEAGETIEFENDGAASAGVAGYVVLIRPAALGGTAVAGVQTAPTATTGDVRGTYDPAAAADGSKSFGLLAYIPDPAYRGVDNYDG